MWQDWRSMPTSNRPSVCTDEMLDFLDGLRESGKLNMFGAASVLRDTFVESLTQAEACKVLAYWIESFGDKER